MMAWLDVAGCVMRRFLVGARHAVPGFAQAIRKIRPFDRSNEGE